jgi:putative ABC transport system ATP-binding protein
LTLALDLEDLHVGWPGQDELFVLANLRLEKGQSLFISGSSGSGKTSLLSVLSGVLVARRGRCRVLGHDFSALASTARDRVRGESLGIIFQQFNLLGFMSVLDNVLMPTQLFVRRNEDACRLHGSALKQAQSLLEQLGVAPQFWGQAAHQLSVGQQQRVAAARAFMGQPSLVLADEPTSALDDLHRDRFLELLASVGGQAGASLVVVSHDQRLANRFDQRLLLGRSAGASE